eukprot:740992-Pyramimonas_sp.AAC.1
MARTWKSVRAGKVEWTEDDVKSVANDILTMIPPSVKTMICEDKLVGDLIQPFIRDDPSNMSCGLKELEQNFVFLMPFVEKCPDRVPSGFVITDARAARPPPPQL